MKLQKEYDIKNLSVICVIPESGIPSVKVRGGVQVGEANVGLNKEIELTEEQSSKLITLRDEIFASHKTAIIDTIEKDVAVTIASQKDETTP